jgi:hypothetical protein
MKVFISLIFAIKLFSLGGGGQNLRFVRLIVGGVSEHQEDLRAASRKKLMRERYKAEPEEMAQNQTIQKLALKCAFRRMIRNKVGRFTSGTKRGSTLRTFN